MATRITRWLDRIDPEVRRRVKGLRLVTAYGIAAVLGALHRAALPWRKYGFRNSTTLFAELGRGAATDLAVGGWDIVQHLCVFPVGLLGRRSGFQLRRQPR